MNETEIKMLNDDSLSDDQIVVILKKLVKDNGERGAREKLLTIERTPRVNEIFMSLFIK